MSLYSTVLREPAPFWTFIFLWISLPLCQSTKMGTGDRARALVLLSSPPNSPCPLYHRPFHPSPLEFSRTKYYF